MEIVVREPAVNTEAPAPDVAIPRATASAIAVYPTQRWPRNFRDLRVLILLRQKTKERGRERSSERMGGWEWRLHCPSALSLLHVSQVSCSNSFLFDLLWISALSETLIGVY